MAIQPHSPLELEPWNNLNGKVVMVTGASAGLGREFCLDLARAGCKIIAAARRIDKLQSLCDEINRLDFSTSSSLEASSSSSMATVESRRAVALELDVSTDGKSIEKCIRKAWSSFGFIDALVNNAGLRGTVKSPMNLSEEEWNEVMNTNVRGCWLVSKYICIHMNKANRGGSIINISSISGLNRVQQSGCIAYSSSKTALNTLTKVMAMELGRHKIRVNSISPGLFKSEITKDLMEKDWLKNVVQRIVPLQTLGTSEPAITTLIQYLLHDSSQYVSGNIFIVDAGTTLPGIPIFSSL
ncbi:3-oxoacyl-[acyl-carrier-protein] reductase FabG-like [Benincasa hispida]|uniref:3-oxoacyl-[acyl-carrier-protein] reductase FabG-like n=1 Tax=Benincasa hispida TaxID=102211 RepID=UPI0019024505|nr:3-oxoacyl-[acyl-carrier-protein] reductase FabG-like [Benincasa hispida]